MAKTGKERQLKNLRGWLLKAAVLLVIFGSAIYVFILGLRGGDWELKRRPDYHPYELQMDSYLKEVYDIRGYGGIQKVYEIPVTQRLVSCDDIGVWMVHAYVEITINGKVLYRCSEPERPHIGHSPGCYWVFLPLDWSDVGETMRLVVTPAYSEVNSRVPQVYAGRRDLIAGNRLLDEIAIVSVALLCILGGIVFTVLSNGMREHSQERRTIRYLGLMLLFLGLWKFMDSPAVYALLFSTNHLLTQLSLLALLMIVPAVSAYMYWLDPSQKVFRWVNRGYLLFDAAVMLLQVSGLRDLRQNLIPVQISILAFVVLVLEKNIYGLRNNDHAIHKWSFILVGISSVGDLVIYMYGYTSFYLGITLTTTLFYGIINGVILLVQASERQERMRRQETQLKESRMALMMSQIRPHFIYNTLNSIYVLCGKDPERARKAIYDFSRYLRINFEQMDKTQPVPFKEELEHVRFYLSIEQMRFADAFSVEYDIQTQDFVLPALSLQPLVENAIRHGIRSSRGSGNLKISTFTLGDEDCIVVEDDGEGFDVAAWEQNLREHGGEDENGRRHVGLANVRDRIMQAGGRMEIESRIGKGTRMIVRIPKEKTELSEKQNRPGGWFRNKIAEVMEEKEGQE